MNNELFTYFRDLIYRESGISLKDEKKPLLENRIFKRLRALGLKNESEYLQILETDLTGEELVQLIDAVSTNLTYFYREDEHFKVLGDIFKAWNTEQKSEIRTWCAAASSGEEPYTIAITAMENLNFSKTTFKLLATDICTKVLNHAQIGLYKEKQFKHMPPHIRKKYFKKVVRNGDPYEEVSNSLKSIILYKRLNLSQFPFPLKGPLDIVFCRNVMIYFDISLRKKIINEFWRLLNPGGYLFLSRSENLLGVSHNFKTVGVSVYQKPLVS